MEYKNTRHNYGPTIYDGKMEELERSLKDARREEIDSLLKMNGYKALALARPFLSKDALESMENRYATAQNARAIAFRRIRDLKSRIWSAKSTANLAGYLWLTETYSSEVMKEVLNEMEDSGIEII